MTLPEALIALDALYWEQCGIGDPHCRLVSGTGDNQRVIRLTEHQGADCFVCLREQYGAWEDCPMPAYREDWELQVLP
jgi:hypothetical protein